MVFLAMSRECPGNQVRGHLESIAMTLNVDLESWTQWRT